MDAKGFRELVRVMRSAQSTYYREKTQTNLLRAMALEKKVDQELAQDPAPVKAEQLAMGFAEGMKDEG